MRTPLSAILGWATILRTGKCSAADMQEGLEVIERNCKVQAMLIEDVLDVSRIVSGKLRLQIRPTELADVIGAAIDVVRAAADAKGVQIQTTLDPTASRTSCDANRLQQVIWNLLTNALKFTPRGRSIRVTLAREGSSARIDVIDHGQGIDPIFLPYVFDRFRQAENSGQRKLGGLGLGLSIVRHIVQAHGGSVNAESAGEGHGATFSVHLPVRAVHSEEADDGTPNRSDPLSLPDAPLVRLDGLRILIVDDKADARRLLVKVLGDAGGEVIAVGSVAEAMTAVLAVHPNVLLSDIAMPDQDGYELIRQVRAAGYSARDLPAIALTAFAHKDDRLRVLQAGFQVHVSKPIHPHELVVAVASLAGRTGLLPTSL